MPDVPRASLEYIEAQYAQFAADPASVDATWRAYFGRLDGDRPAAAAAPAPAESTRIVLPPDRRLGSLTERVPFLHGLRTFSALPEAELRELASLTEEEAYPDGELLFSEGDEGSDLFIVVAGSVLVVREGRIVAELGPGQVLGEMAVLDRAPRSADARARGELRVLRLRGEHLVARLDRPGLAHGLIRGLIRRLREKDTRQDRVDQLIRAYRVRGHLLADLDPLGARRTSYPELELEHYDLAPDDLNAPFSTHSIAGVDVMSLREIVELMRETYCGSIGAQFMHIDDLAKKTWLQTAMEDRARRRRLSRAEQLRILTKLTDAEVFEQFLARKFLGAKRFSLEGAETLIPLLDLAFEEASAGGVREVVIGMPHRGRLNVLANILGKSPRQIFREFDDADAHLYLGRGDVKYHLGFNGVYATDAGELALSLTFNPSHLEFVGPVVAGRVRAKQDRRADAGEVLGVVLHGDSAFAGQGVVQEMLNMSGLPGYATGGTLHIIVNNQIGFTTPPGEGRSTQYATDVARMLQTPIFHVNGEHPEAVAQVVRWAMAYRARFGTDVIIDMYCYRRHGHNEGDEPAYTQPLMYHRIRRRKSVVEGYLDSLLMLGEVSGEEAAEIAGESRARLDAELDQARASSYQPLASTAGEGLWAPYVGGPSAEAPDASTAVSMGQLAELLDSLASVPEGFDIHPKLAKLLGQRRAMAHGEKPLDWAAAEALALASLLVEGHPVRLSGQDAERGTFSHRHAVLHDQTTDEHHVPLQHLGAEQGPFRVYNSPLCEIGVLGYDWGYSLDAPEGLTIWEAQFGDFSNVAQVIIDQFISSSEDKWHRLSGLVMLLPHGFEGAGPEHSSARPERFLELAAEDNMQVVNLTTPAQLFHALRRQVKRRWRKPLIVMSPKSLLRHPQVTSDLAALAGDRFRPVLPDTTGPAPDDARRVVLTSGKLYYELLAARQERNLPVALVRLEQYYPLPVVELQTALVAYPDGIDVVWAQEEPRNMGAWRFLRDHLGERVLGRWPWRCISRPASASPATGSAAAHRQEQAALIDLAFTLHD